MSENVEQTGLAKFLGIAQVSHEGVAEAIKHQIVEGLVNPIEVLLALKRMQKVIELTIDGSKGDKEIKEILYKAVQTSLDGGKSLDMMGANLRIQDTGVRYDYTDCNDKYLNALYEIQNTVAENIKQREAEIKAIVPPEDNKKLGIRSRVIVQEYMPHLEFLECGEDNTIFPPVRKAGSSIICTFKKQK
jgi:hypothetical protein